MAITSLHAQEFAHDVHKAFTAAENGPVVIMNCGAPSHVLLNYLDYQLLLAMKQSIVSSLAMPSDADVEFEAPRVNICLRPADFL